MVANPDIEMTYPDSPHQLDSMIGFVEFEFPIFGDHRGYFRTWFSQSVVLGKGHHFIPMQSNISRSQKNVIRGIHFSDASYEQSKVITCISGSILDVAVDLRLSSETFGKHSKIELSAEKGNSAFVSHGLGHAFEVLSDEATIVYLLSSEWNPNLEYAINPLDPSLKIKWHTGSPLLSEKDSSAPSLAEYFNS